MSETFFSSDLHFWHKNIIKYCNRPFESVEEMNETLVKNFNSLVSPKDTTYFLGDMVFGAFDLNRLNGDKILIIGNHDNTMSLQKYFEGMSYYMELKKFLPGQQPIVLMHYPIESWNGKFHNSIHLHGHTHGTLDNTGLLRFDVGVDSWDMKPTNIEQILELIPKRKEEAELLKASRDAKFKQLNETADRDSIISKLEELKRTSTMGSCNCLTKTSEVKHHWDRCQYRIISENVDGIINSLKV